MSRWNRVVLLLVFVLATGGSNCLAKRKPRATIDDDPFLPTVAKRDDDAPEMFAAGNRAARERDQSREVSTTPTNEPVAKKDEPRRQPTDPNDPFHEDGVQKEKTDAIASARDDGKESAQRNASAEEPAPDDGPDRKEFQEIRERLERVGAKFREAEKDPTTGEYLFRCEAPHPRNAELLRVFEATDRDERKAMLAVTEHVEKWVAQQRAGGAKEP